MVNTDIVGILSFNPDPVNVEVEFKVDDVALEATETATLELMVLSAEDLLVPTGEGIFFLNTIQLFIIDQDGNLLHFCC